MYKQKILLNVSTTINAVHNKSFNDKSKIQRCINILSITLHSLTDRECGYHFNLQIMHADITHTDLPHWSRKPFSICIDLVSAFDIIDHNILYFVYDY